MRGTVRKWGNSAAVRLPAAVMQAARLELNAPVEVREEDGRVVIEPVRDAEAALADLLAGITDENRHEVVNVGPPVGDEAL
ncbi:MAG: AbrB/MazE/SpoVT family DNA-binding domain-containing protein [Litorimonas sp.]